MKKVTTCDYCYSVTECVKVWSDEDDYLYLCRDCRGDVDYCRRGGKEPAVP